MEFLKQMRKASLRKMLPLSIIFIVIAVVLLVVFSGYRVFQVLFPRSITELTPENMEGAYVTADIPLFYAQYAEVELTRNGRKTGTITGAQYVVDFNDTHFMGLFVHSGDLDDAKTMLSMSNDYFSGKIRQNQLPVLHVRGTITAMSSQEENYYMKTASGDAALKALMLPYYLDMGRAYGCTMFGYWAAFIGAVVLIVLGVYFLVKAATGGYQKKLKARISEMGPDSSAVLERLDQFYANTQPVSGVRIGSEFLLFQTGAVTMLFRPWELAWAYQQTTRRRTNGIPSGKSYAAIFRMMDGKQYTLGMKQGAVQALLEHLSTAAPAVVLGYTGEIAQAYTQNRAWFASRWEEVRPGCTGKR